MASTVVGLVALALVVGVLVLVGRPDGGPSATPGRLPATITPSRVAAITPLAQARPVPTPSPAVVVPRPTPTAATPTAAALARASPTATGAWIPLVPDRGRPGARVELQGYLPDASGAATSQADPHANVCWAACPGGLADEGLPLQWSPDQPGHFAVTFTVPAAPWLDGAGFHPLTIGDYVVGFECPPVAAPPPKGPGKVPCSHASAAVTATFHLTGPVPTACGTLPCGHLDLSPASGPPGTLVQVRGWAPLNSVLIADRPFPYQLVLARGDGPSDTLNGELQQDPDGTLVGSFRVPLTLGDVGDLTPGAYTVALQTFAAGPVGATSPTGVTATPMAKGSAIWPTLAPMPFTVTAPLTWAILGSRQPLWIQPSADVFGVGAFAVDPADPRRLAYCAPGAVRLSSDGGATWANLPTDTVGSAAAETPFEFPAGLPAPPRCAAVALDPRHPASVYVAFSMEKVAYHSAPPTFLVGFATADAGRTWRALPAPPGDQLDQFAFGGFEVTDRGVLALFSAPQTTPGPPPTLVEQTTDGGRSWLPAELTCPAPGPCVRWGAASTSITGMGATLPQPIEVSPDGGRTWASPSWPGEVWLRRGSAELFATGPTTVALLGTGLDYPLLISSDGGQTWRDVALPTLPSAAGGTSGSSDLTILPDGRLLAAAENGWLLLGPGATAWCPVAGAPLPPSGFARPRPIGARLWWLEDRGATDAGATSVSVAGLRCGPAAGGSE
jgi:hypothetical protein